MTYYPVLMDVRERTCLVVGGGAVGYRKAMGLLRAGARVRVVSPEMDGRLAQAAQDEPGLTLIRRPFADEDLEGMSLAFAATDNPAVNAGVRQAAAGANVLCNAAEGEDKGDFILPAVVARGDLLIAISTCGASPALSKRLRRELEQAFGPEYGELARLLAAVRSRLLARGGDPEENRKVFTVLVERDLAPLIAAQDIATLNTILFQVLGEGFSWDDLRV